MYILYKGMYICYGQRRINISNRNDQLIIHQNVWVGMVRIHLVPAPQNGQTVSFVFWLITNPQLDLRLSDSQHKYTVY